MRIVFEHWKYIFRNVWFVLPFAIMPAIFLALSLDFDGIEAFSKAFFGGGELTFAAVFRAWSIIRFDSALGAVYSVCALICIVCFLSLLLAFVEKHMRIGKRTLSGVFSQLGDQIFAVTGIVLLYLALYEIWALVLSAMIYSVSALGAQGVAYFLFVVIVFIFFALLLYLTTMIYLWLPCMQITGMRAYNAFLYSYRLMMGVRGELLLSLTISFVPMFFIVWGSAFLPKFVAVLISFVLIAVLFLSFSIRMETFYFDTDKIDREDLLRSYREL